MGIWAGPHPGAPESEIKDWETMHAFLQAQSSLMNRYWLASVLVGILTGLGIVTMCLR